MPSIVLEHIKGEEVTRRIEEAIQVYPEGTYRVTVQIEDEALANAASLIEVAKIVSERAQSRGLTPEILRNIIDDDD